MGIGELYNPNAEFVANVNYQIQNDSSTNWWGELSLMEYCKIDENGGYIIVLEDGRKGKVFLKKRVNRAVTGIPPRYVYHFSGASLLE